MTDAPRTTLLKEARALVAASGFETLRLTLGQDRLLRLVLDHPQRAVDSDDATRMNVRLRKALLARGYPMDDYRIEVESPGADRPLTEPKHFARFQGSRIRLVRKGGEAKDRVLTGLLEAADGAGIRVQPEGKDRPVLQIPYSDVAEARLDPKLPF